MTWRVFASSLWSAARDIAAAALSAHPETAAAPAVTVGRVTLTGAEVRALYAVASHLVTRTANVADAEAVAEITIDAALSAVAPGLAELAIPAANALADLLLEGIASGTIHGDPDPIHDAQTHETPHSGRRP